MTKPKYQRSRPYYATPEEKAELVARFAAGTPARELARQSRRAVGSILAWAAAAGVHEPKTIQRVDDQTTAKIVELYKTGRGGESIGAEVGHSGHVVRAVLERQGVERRAFEDMHARPYPLWEEAFDKLTPESAYWLGFLMADGAIGGHDHRILLALAVKDKEHLHKFRTFMRSMHPIVERGHVDKRSGKAHRYARIQFYSKRVEEALGRWGVTPRKSHTATALRGLDQNRDFWRGVVDGDGSLGLWLHGGGVRYPGLSLIGSEPLIRQFAAWTETTLSLSPSVEQQKRSFTVSFCGANALKVVHALYDNACVALSRKLDMISRLDAVPVRYVRSKMECGGSDD